MKKRLLILAAALLTMAPLSASAAGRRPIVVGRPYFSGWYSPYWGPSWGPYWGVYWGPGYNANPNMGEVKLDTKVKDAQVFINNAYAGTTQENKTMHLRPGRYDIEIRVAGHTQYAESVYVVAGKTLHLHPML